MAFYVIENSGEFPITQKGTNVPKMRTRARMQIFAIDRARCLNVPMNFLLYVCFKVHYAAL